MKLILKLVLLCLSAFFLAVLLAGGLLLLIVSLLRWLLTGQRPQIVAFVSAVNQWKKGKLWPSKARSDTASNDNIVDVDVKDVTKTNQQPSIAKK